MKVKSLNMSAEKKHRKKEWYRDSFSGEYLWLYAHRSDREAQKQMATALKILEYQKGQRVLDLACGAGRHALALAKRGARVTGVDLSSELLSIARQKIKDKGYTASFKRQDMREIGYENRFDGVMMWFTSFGYFPNKRDDRKVLRNVLKALRPGGWWWIDLLNPAWLEKTLVKNSERTVEGPNGTVRVIETRSIAGGHVKKTTRIVDRGQEKIFKENVRLYNPEQFGTLLHSVGLSAKGVLGDYDGTALTSKTPRQIWFGEKPNQSK